MPTPRPLNPGLRKIPVNFRERTLNIFQHKPVDNIVFQPRMDYWFNRNKELGRLPPSYQDMQLLDFYDALGCSPRPYAEYGACLEIIDSPDLKRETLISRAGEPFHPALRHLGNLFSYGIQFNWDVFPPPYGQIIERVETPLGALDRHIVYTDSSYHTIKYPLESLDDIRVMKYILESRAIRFNPEHFLEAEARIRLRSAPMLCLPRTNIQRLNVDLMGFEKTIFALYDQPEVMEDLIRVIDETDELYLDALVESPITIVNFDDNIDQNLVAPSLFQRYILPAYQRRTERLHAAGKTCHSHWDGMCPQLLRFIPETGLDGVEALTLEPMGVLTISQIKEALGERVILLDGIPMTSFLPGAPDGELERITRQLIETFAPDLILGISDEPSPDCSIDKIRRVVEIVNEYEGSIMDLARKRVNTSY